MGLKTIGNADGRVGHGYLACVVMNDRAGGIRVARVHHQSQAMSGRAAVADGNVIGDRNIVLGVQRQCRRTIRIRFSDIGQDRDISRVIAITAVQPRGNGDIGAGIERGIDCRGENLRIGRQCHRDHYVVLARE